MSQQTVTEQATAGSGPAPARDGMLQRQCACGTHMIAGGECAACSEERGRTLQRSAIGNHGANVHDNAVPPIVNEVLRSPGQPLDTDTRTFFEPRLGHDFSTIPTHTVGLSPAPASLTAGHPADQFEVNADAVAEKVTGMPPASPEAGYDLGHVRIHTDERAAESARAVNALAYTVGSQIVFDTGQFAPETNAGRHLLAHELTHVLQQDLFARGGGFDNSGTLLQRQPAPAPTPAPAGPAPGREYAGPDAVPAPPPSPAAPEAAAAPKFEETLDYEAIAIELRKAMEIWGTDEEAVYFALNRLRQDPKAIQRLKDHYKTKYKIELLDEINDEFSGTEREYALQLLNAGTKGSEQEIGAKTPTTMAEWRAAAERLNAAFEIFWGTDEEAVYATLTPFRRQMELLDKLKLVYQALYKQSLRDRIADEMSGSELNYALWLLGEQPIHQHEATAEGQAATVLAYIKTEAEARAKAPPSILPSSTFYNVLRTRYLSGYFASPTPETGKKAAEEEIGRPMEGKVVKAGNQLAVMVRPRGGGWRPAKSDWERKGITWLNNQELPTQLSEMKDMPLLKNLQGLPRNLGAATDILIKENTDTLPFIDVPFLIGQPNPEIADFNADVRGGGKNISQLMHWATGVKYAKEKPEALRELFLAYELWHLEGLEVFGQDSINDLIAENQGRILGAELMKGSAGALKSEADLLPFLNRSFLESRAWVGTILGMRKSQLDNWILAKQQKPANMHYMEKDDIWHSLTVYQMLADKIPIEEVKKSFIVESAIEIYTLVYEADEWATAHGPIVLTSMEKALVEGKLDKLLEIMAKAEVGKASLGDLITASGAIKDLKGIK